MSHTLRLVLFASLLTVMISSTHLLMYRRLIRDVQPRKALKRLGGFTLATLCVAMLGGVFFGRFTGGEGSRAVAFAAYTWFGVISLALMVLLPLEGVRLLGRLGARFRRGQSTLLDPDRRLALSRATAAVTALGVSGASAAGVSSVLAGPELRRLTVPIDGLPAAFEGFTIAQVSDIHVGPTIKRPFMEEMVARINALRPDMVAITGDLVDGSVPQLGADVAPLGELQSTHGTFFCTGNHEYYSGVEPWMAYLERLGVQVLKNARVTLTRGADAIDVAGVHDWMSSGPGHGHDLAKALAGQPEARKTVLLAHQPRAVHDAADKGVELMLSGHTHGGQLWPFRFIVGLVQPYVQGLHKHKGRTWIYVHPGTGYWGPPMRVGVPAEIALITLTSAGRAL